MKRVAIGQLSAASSVVTAIVGISIATTWVAPDAAAQAAVPEIRFDANVRPLGDLPSGEVAGVAVDAAKSVYVFIRTGAGAVVHGESAARLFKYSASGVLDREFGKNLYGFSFAHTVRVDRDNNVWATDEGTNMVIKFSPQGRVLLVLGRRPESVEGPAAPVAPGTQPRAVWGTFNRPTDVTWDLEGNIFVADGYTNSRVVKIDKHGRWVKTWGTRGAEPGQFNILHTIASDAKGNIYVGDRSNNRIQVFDNNGTLLRIIKIEVPFTKPVNVLIGAEPGPNSLATSGAPWAMCISPGPVQHLFVADAVPGRIYKLTLDGTVVGTVGEAGKQPGQFGWIHQIACPTENDLMVAELLNWRVQKLKLYPTPTP